MTAKPSRTGSSWRHLDDGEPQQSSIFSFGYPIRAGAFDLSKVGGFLEQCCYCKKRIGQDVEVFMYGDLCGFCTAQCRGIQIANDRKAKRQRLKSKKVVHVHGFSL